MITDFKTIFESRFTWIEGFMRNVRRYGNKPAMFNPENSQFWTYTELNKEVNRLSNALMADGLKNAGRGSGVVRDIVTKEVILR